MQGLELQTQGLGSASQVQAITCQAALPSDGQITSIEPITRTLTIPYDYISLVARKKCVLENACFSNRKIQKCVSSPLKCVSGLLVA